MGSRLAFAWCSCWRLPLDRFFPGGKWPALGRYYPAGARRSLGLEMPIKVRDAEVIEADQQTKSHDF